MKKIKISAVSYLNTIPFIYGIEQDEELLESIELSKDIPSVCASKLLNNDVDLGLVPVAIIPLLEEAHIISDYCIGAVGKVKSVLLLSDVPLDEIESIYLDYQSKTSVKLCQILCEHHWGISPEFIVADEQYESKIQGKSAGVIIGDRTFNLEKEYAFQFDLSEEWEKMTGLPFVFAAWVSNKKLEGSFIKKFNKALAKGVDNVDLAIESKDIDGINKVELKSYLTDNISYDFKTDKKESLKFFLKLI